MLVWVKFFEMIIRRSLLQLREIWSLCILEVFQKSQQYPRGTQVCSPNLVLPFLTINSQVYGISEFYLKWSISLNFWTCFKFLINLGTCYSWSNIHSAQKSTYILISTIVVRSYIGSSNFFHVYCDTKPDPSCIGESINFTRMFSFDNSVLNLLSVWETLSRALHAQKHVFELHNFVFS